MKKIVIPTAIIFGIVLLISIYIHCSKNSESHDSDYTYYSYKNDDFKLEAFLSDNVILNGDMTIIHVKKGDVKKEYVFWENAIPSLDVTQIDMTNDGLEDYVVQYMLSSGAGGSIRCFVILEGKSLSIIDPFGAFTYEQLNKFTPAQNKVFTTLMDELKEKDPEVLYDWHCGEDMFFQVFSQDVYTYNGENGIAVHLMEYTGPTSMIMVDVFLKYDTKTKEFEIVDVLGYQRIDN